MLLEIDLKFDKDEFRSMYFRDHQDSYILGPKTKPRFIAVFVITILAPLITISAHDTWASLMLISWAAFLLIWVDYIMMVYKIGKWKKEIYLELDRQETIQKRRLVLSDQALTLIQDNVETTCEWADFDEGEISARFIWLHGDVDYYFPASSMSLENYKAMSTMVKEKTAPEEIDLLDEI